MAEATAMAKVLEKCDLAKLTEHFSGVGNAADQNATTTKTRSAAIFEKRFEFEQALIREAIESAEARLNHLLDHHLDADASSDNHRVNAYLTEARSKLIDLERQQNRQELEEFNEASKALRACRKKFDEVIASILSTNKPPGRHSCHHDKNGNRNKENANRVIGWELEKMLEDIEKFFVRNQKAACEELCKFAVDRYREFEANFEAIRKKNGEGSEEKKADSCKQEAE